MIQHELDISLLKKKYHDFSKKVEWAMEKLSIDIQPPKIFLFKGGSLAGLYVVDKNLVGFNVVIDTERNEDVKRLAVHEVLHYLGIDHGPEYDGEEFSQRMFHLIGSDWRKRHDDAVDRYEEVMKKSVCPVMEKHNIIEIVFMDGQPHQEFRKIYIEE